MSCRMFYLMGMMVAGVSAPVEAKVKAGDQAPMFKTLDENMKPVDTKDLIKGRPLVMTIGSCS